MISIDREYDCELELHMNVRKENEDIFKNELEIFRTEVHSAIQFFYAYLSINNALSRNEQALKLAEKTPRFWNTNLRALQTSFFIALDRIFAPNKKTHDVSKLIKEAQDRCEIFSSMALKARKREGSANADEWIDEYMKDIYVPIDDDFRRLRKDVHKYRKIYENNYSVLRNKVFAHRELSSHGEIQALFSKTNIREIHELLMFLNWLHEALWQLFHNGRKPALFKTDELFGNMNEAGILQWQRSYIQEDIENETFKFFEILSTASSAP